MALSALACAKFYLLKVVTVVPGKRLQKLARALCSYCENVTLIEDMRGHSVSGCSAAGYCSV
jgi:hypothetical protein